jgi:hypothetical protein
MNLINLTIATRHLAACCDVGHKAGLMPYVTPNPGILWLMLEGILGG